MLLFDFNGNILSVIPDRPFFKARQHNRNCWVDAYFATNCQLQTGIEVNLHQMTEWRDAVCVDSISHCRCIVEKSYATVTGLIGSAIYHFRVYAILNVAESHPSIPSVGLSPRGELGISLFRLCI